MYDSDTRQTTPPADGAAPRPAVLTWLFFPAALLYHELLLRAFDSQSLFFAPAPVLVVLCFAYVLSVPIRGFEMLLFRPNK